MSGTCIDMGYTKELPVTTSLLSSLSCLFSVEATEAPSAAAGAGGSGVAPEPDVAAAAAHGHHTLLIPVKHSRYFYHPRERYGL